MKSNSSDGLSGFKKKCAVGKKLMWQWSQPNNLNVSLLTNILVLCIGFAWLERRRCDGMWFVSLESSEWLQDLDDKTGLQWVCLNCVDTGLLWRKSMQNGHLGNVGWTLTVVWRIAISVRLPNHSQIISNRWTAVVKEKKKKEDSL